MKVLGFPWNYGYAEPIFQGPKYRRLHEIYSVVSRLFFYEIDRKCAHKSFYLQLITPRYIYFKSSALYNAKCASRRVHRGLQTNARARCTFCKTLQRKRIFSWKLYYRMLEPFAPHIASSSPRTQKMWRDRHEELALAIAQVGASRRLPIPMHFGYLIIL